MNKDPNEIVEEVLDRKRGHGPEWIAIIIAFLATGVSFWQGWIAQKSLTIVLNEQQRAEDALKIAQRPGPVPISVEKGMAYSPESH